MAVDVLKERGVAEERILFLNLISSPEGIERFSSKFPKLHVITAFIDQVSFSAISVSLAYLSDDSLANKLLLGTR